MALFLPYMKYDAGDALNVDIREFKQVICSPPVNTHEVDIMSIKNSQDFISPALGVQNNETNINIYSHQSFRAVTFEIKSKKNRITAYVPLKSTSSYKKQKHGVLIKSRLNFVGFHCTGITDYSRFNIDENCSGTTDKNAFLKWMKALENCTSLKKPKDFNDFSQKFRLNFSYDENNDYESNYKRLKKKFNKKYDVYLGFMDGNHRMCLFHHLLHNDALSDSLCVEEKSTKKNWTINHETSYIHEKYTLDLYCSTRKLPSTRMCRDLSYMIFRNQNESFHETHGDIFMEMINQYFSLKSIHRVDDLTEDKWRPKSKNNDKFEEVFKDVFMVPIGNLLCSKGLNIGRKCRKLTEEEIKKMKKKQQYQNSIAENTLYNDKKTRPADVYLLAMEWLKMIAFDKEIGHLLKMILRMTSENSFNEQTKKNESIGKIEFETDNFFKYVFATSQYVSKSYLNFFVWWDRKKGRNVSHNDMNHQSALKLMIRVHIAKSILKAICKKGLNPKVDFDEMNKVNMDYIWNQYLVMAKITTEEDQDSDECEHSTYVRKEKGPDKPFWYLVLLQYNKHFYTCLRFIQEHVIQITEFCEAEKWGQKGLAKWSRFYPQNHSYTTDDNTTLRLILKFSTFSNLFFKSEDTKMMNILVSKINTTNPFTKYAIPSFHNMVRVTEKKITHQKIHAIAKCVNIGTGDITVFQQKKK